MAGTALFFVLVPLVVGGLVPWGITRWTDAGDFGDAGWTRFAGAILILAGLVALLESFVRFAWKGYGTPAPLAPTDRLITSGQYRHVRNPMYIAVLSCIAGQALMLGQAQLLAYAATFWLIVHAFVIGYEEPRLRQQFPRDYPAYFDNVRRWFPRLRPWTTSGRTGES